MNPEPAAAESAAIGVWEAEFINDDDVVELVCPYCETGEEVTLCGAVAEGEFVPLESKDEETICPNCLIAAYSHSCYDPEDLKEFLA